MSRALFHSLPLLLLIAAWLIGHAVLTIAQTPREQIASYAAAN